MFNAGYFPSGLMVKNPSGGAGNKGSIPGQGNKTHMPRSNEDPAPARGPQLESGYHSKGSRKTPVCLN